MAFNTALLFGYVIIAVLSSVPLFIATTLLGGNTGIIKTILVNVLCAVLLSVIHHFMGRNATIMGLIALIVVYKYMFELGWIRAFLVLLVQWALIMVFAYFGLHYLSWGSTIITF